MKPVAITLALIALGTMLAASSPEPEPGRYMVDGFLFDATIPMRWPSLPPPPALNPFSEDT